MRRVGLAWVMVAAVSLAAPRDATREVTVPVVTLEASDGGNERFAVRVSARRCNSGMVPFTVAWRSSGASLQAVPSTIGSAP